MLSGSPTRIDTPCDFDFTDVAGTDNLNIMSLNHMESIECRMLGDEDLDLRTSSIRIHTCVRIHYQLIENGVLPYLRFKLNINKGLLEFETFKLTHKHVPTVEHETYCGLYEYENLQYLFYKNDSTRQEVTQITKHDQSYWLTVDDIVNLKQYFNIGVLEQVTRFLQSILNLYA